MPSLKEKALNFVTRDITALNSIPVDIEIKSAEFEKNGKKMSYDYIEIDNWKYTIKADLLKQIKEVVANRPLTKNIKVNNTPAGIMYVIPID